jgi:hypothetical protein
MHKMCSAVRCRPGASRAAMQACARQGEMKIVRARMIRTRKAADQTTGNAERIMPTPQRKKDRGRRTAHEGTGEESAGVCRYKSRRGGVGEMGREAKREERSLLRLRTDGRALGVPSTMHPPKHPSNQQARSRTNPPKCSQKAGHVWRRVLGSAAMAPGSMAHSARGLNQALGSSMRRQDTDTPMSHTPLLRTPPLVALLLRHTPPLLRGQGCHACWPASPLVRRHHQQKWAHPATMTCMPMGSRELADIQTTAPWPGAGCSLGLGSTRFNVYAQSAHNRR